MIAGALMLGGCSASSQGGGGPKEEEAVYLGVEGYGLEDRNIDNKHKFNYRFFVGGKEVLYTIDNGERKADGVFAYPVQNRLMEGYLYDMKVKDGMVTSVSPLFDDSEWVVSGELKSKDPETGIVEIGSRKVLITNETGVYSVTIAPGGAHVEAAKPQIGDHVRAVLNSNGKAASLYIMPVADPYVPPVQGEPGQRTLLNFLRTAMMPAGNCLYVYGGGWNWQNTGSGTQSVSIGYQSTWNDFFHLMDSDYVFRKRNAEDPDDPEHSYYPYQHYNEYYYAGLDCSGFIGWAVYNTLNTTDGEEGYVVTSTEMPINYSNRGWGAYTRDLIKPVDHNTSMFLPGDIVSISGHVWLCLGTCDDGSILILHSSPTDSRTGGHGGGLQLTALGQDKNCEAYLLADRYMGLFYPEWYARYEPQVRAYEKYADMMSDINAGKFSWDVSGRGILTDPDGVRAMRPSEVLEKIFAGF